MRSPPYHSGRHVDTIILNEIAVYRVLKSGGAIMFVTGDKPVKNGFAMKKSASKKTTKKPREKPLSLYGMSFDEAVTRAARAKPSPRQAKKK